MNWYFEVLKKYAVFSGRARRKEYWLFTLCNSVINVVLMLIGTLLLSTIGASDLGVIIPSIYSLAVLVPSLAVVVRRLHDTNRSGWYFFLNLIPLIGSIILLVFLVQDSDPNENRHGPNPKATTE